MIQYHDESVSSSSKGIINKIKQEKNVFLI
ncbi:BnaA06g39600D [Brassica napus]|uniref:BnaA06g39600D protein n=1 Tax=Brassica napus TaxID=3708 RepID=A0A078JTJ1_BRANA|nr:BnaA06g39600D [Brassica napus]